MTDATSPYLNVPPRDLDEVRLQRARRGLDRWLIKQRRRTTERLRQEVEAKE